MKRKIRVREIVNNMGVKSVIALTLVFVLAVSATVVGGIQLYHFTRESIYLQGRMNRHLSKPVDIDKLLDTLR